MSNYENAIGTKMTVEQKGKGFTTRRHYLASKRVPTETVTRNHRSYSAVEKIIICQDFVEVK